MKKQLQHNRAFLSKPGDTILETIEYKKMTQAELAERMGKTPSKINDVITGKEPITITTALQLETVLGVPANFWLNREATYRERLARIEEEEELECYLPWANVHPVKELKKCGYLIDAEPWANTVKKLLLFYGVVSPQQWEVLYVPAYTTTRFRKSVVHEATVASTTAWLRMGELEMKKREWPAYDRDAFREAIAAIRDLAVQQPKDFAARLQQLGAKAGVAVVYTKCLSKAPVSGAARWIGGNPLIQLTDRYKSNDRFWFTFFHEAAHILLHGKKDAFLEGVENLPLDDEKEKEADRFAARVLLPEKFMEDISAPVTKETIVHIAGKYNIHPGIVVGRLQKNDVISYSMYNGFKEKVSLFD